ncbi:MAG TPA: 16S rRNA (cytidine(1402)-2'-O)-methyltransferase [Gemmatimonadaceae bacterium]
MTEPKTGALFVVSTPIGNMGDFSFRAVEVLKSVALVLAEDTRHSRALLDRYAIPTPVSSYHEHNEATATPKLVERLAAGDDLALISDAGTPLLSDPGQRLVNAALEAGIRVLPVPGASAMLAALVASGLSAERFTFYGFLPRKGGDRAEAIDSIASSPVTAVLYEGPGRVAATLRDLSVRAPGREAVVARELTKQFEEVRRGTVESLAAYYEETAPRGEVVILVGGAARVSVDEAALMVEARRLRAAGKSVKDATAALMAMGASRNVAYRTATAAGEDGNS